MSDLNQEVAKLLSEFDEEDEKSEQIRKYINELPEEKVTEMLKRINPYSAPTIEDVDGDPNAERETVSLSYTNTRLEFTKRLVTTSMVGYTMRCLKEYMVPEEIKPVEIEDYIRDATVANTPDDIRDPRLIRMYEEYRASMPERVSIYRFLKHIFDYNPDEHVASALQTNKRDETRHTPNVAAVRRALAAPRNTIRANDTRQSYEHTLESFDEDTKHSRNSDNVTGTGNSDNVTGTGEADVAVEATAMIPSLDLMSKYERYLEEHYEEYLDLVKNIYGADPDIDTCIIVYDKHRNADEAKKFKDRHMDHVIAPIINIDKNRWVALGPYRKNRERVDFFNRHTEVLKEMLDQRERDSHIAADIMKKRIKKKKAQNIKEMGPDDKEFLRHIRRNKPAVQQLGAEYVGDAGAAEDSDEEHKDDVEVNVFTLGEGGREMKVHKIYNRKEAPTPDPKAPGATASGPTATSS